jgi:radical SAM protein with 4Fe4S-binding SPASM domain
VRLRTLMVEVTGRCDHACSHCYNRWRRPRGVDGPYPDLAPLLERILEQVDCGDVTLTGGEPLLHPGLPGLVSLLARRGIRVNVISNGHRLDEAACADLIDRGVALFELPLLGYRREVHDRLSGAPGAFDAVLAALAHIRALRGHAAVVFVATRENLDQVAGALELAFALGARGILLNRYNPGCADAGAVARLMPGVDALRRCLETADEVAGRLGLRVSCSVPIQPCLIDLEEFEHLRTGFCAAGTSRAYTTVDASGRVRPCNHTATVLGNVWEEPLREILDPARLERFTHAVPGVCSRCALVETCQGGCRAAAEVCVGRLDDPDPFLAANLERVVLPPART